jgi:hypothetical protein
MTSPSTSIVVSVIVMNPAVVSVGVITMGVSARAGLGCQSEVDPGDHDSGR